MACYGADPAVETKAGDEPVTGADRAADDLIRAGLTAVFPDDGLLTEESEDDRSRLSKERVWIVDPLDGTTEFISGTGEFVVQIALAVDGQPVLGVIQQPTTERLFYATKGCGAYHLINGNAERLWVSTVANPAEMCLIASRSHYTPFIEAARDALGIQSARRAGSVGLKVGAVAHGECDLYLATTVAKEWDICAPHALLLEAGGTMTDLCGGPLIYNKPDLAGCRGLVVSNGRAHDRIVKVVSSLLPPAEAETI
jgi:3'(2'), 5'-bisphosphate nucleotidase